MFFRKKNRSQFKPWHGILLAIVVATALVIGIVQRIAPSKAPQQDIPEQQPVEITQETCEAAGGTWNACGSACRENPDQPCVQVCVEYCECQSDDQCPVGTTCGQFVDNVGVCSEPS